MSQLAASVTLAMTIRLRDIPEHERPRERLWRRGVEALGERELLALVLRSGREGENALNLADALLVEYGGVNSLASARPEELTRRLGLGPAKAAALIAAFRLGRLASDDRAPEVLRSPEDVAWVARCELAGARRERVIVLVCDSRNRLRDIVGITEGAIDRTQFPIRDILNAVLRHDGRAFAVAHNHPSGDETPSQADISATEAMMAGSKVVGLRFLGHIVVTDTKWSSVTGHR